MNARQTFDTRTKVFAVVGLLMVAAYTVAMRGPWVIPGGPPPSWAMAIDLLLVLPFAWVLLKPREWRKRWPAALAIAGAGVLLGRWLAPEDDALWSAIGDLRWLALGLLLAVELWLLSGVVRHVWRAAHDSNPETATAQALQQTFGVGAAGRWMQLESRMWIYALMRKPVTHAFAGTQHFKVARQSGNASNQQGFVILMAAELPVMHLFLHWGFGATVAWVVTAISFFGWLYMWAEYRATCWRPVSIDADSLYLRYGLLIDITLPRQAVIAIEPIARGTRLPHAKTRLSLEGMGRANLRLRLRPGTRALLPWGERELDEIALGIDDPQGFMQALRQQQSGASS